MTINLDSKNVKAWFRRAQARAASEKLEGAKDGALLYCIEENGLPDQGIDFKRTLVLDPANTAVKQELAKVEALLKYRAENVGKVCHKAAHYLGP